MNQVTFDDLIMIESDDPESSDFERILTVNTASQQWLDNEIDSQLYMDVIDSMGFHPSVQLDRIEQVLRIEAQLLNYGFNS